MCVLAKQMEWQLHYADCTFCEQAGTETHVMLRVRVGIMRRVDIMRLM